MSPHEDILEKSRVGAKPLKLGLAMRLFLLMRIDAHQMRIDAHEPHH